MGLKRLCLTPVKRKLPITPALLMRMRMCPNIDWSTPIIVVVLGTMLIAFLCFLRKDNFTVNKVDAFNSHKHPLVNTPPIAMGFHGMETHGNPHINSYHGFPRVFTGFQVSLVKMSENT